MIKKIRTFFVALVAIVVFGGSLAIAHAATFPVNGGSYVYTINTNKSTYSPGESIVVTAILQSVYYCGGDWCHASLHATIDNGAPWPIYYDFGPMFYTGTSQTSFAMTAPSVPGSHTVNLALTYIAGFSWQQDSPSIAFTVAAPPCTYTGPVGPWAPACSAIGTWNTPSGSNVTVNNTAAGYTGSVVYSCSNGVYSYVSQSCTALPPTLSTSVSPSSIAYNSSATISWSSANTNSCYGYSAGSAGATWNTGVWNAIATSGSASTGVLSSTTSFYIYCIGKNGTNVFSSPYPMTVTVAAPPYNYTFNSNGGTPSYATKTQTAGTSVTSPGSPTRTGYTFTGWSPALPTTMPVGGGGATAQWAVNNYTVSASAGAGGTISPSSQTVISGGSTTFTVSPNAGYTASASGCGGSLSGTTYTTGAITGACTVSATFIATNTSTSPTISINPTTYYVGVNNTYTFSAIDLQGDQVRYGIDWNMDGAADEWLPAFPDYVNSGTSRSTSYTWPTTGNKQFQALTQDYQGLNSAWTVRNITVTDAPCANNTINPPTCTQCANNIAYANGGCVDCSTGGCSGTGGNSTNGNSTLTCNSGAINIPNCTVCPVGQTLVGSTCVNNCTNGATNPTTCDACPVGQELIGGICPVTTSCGDSTCNGSETILTCPADCKVRYQQF